MSRPFPEDLLVDRTYEAALIPTRWRDVLDLVSELTEGRGGFLFSVRDRYINAISSESLGDIYDRFVAGGWAARDPRMKRTVALNYPGFVNDGDLMTEDEIATNEVYGFFRENGIGFMACTMIPTPGGDAVAFAFQRHQKSGPVPRHVVSFLDRLRPHLARAALTANRLGFERARAQADALQALGLPGAVLRGHGRLLAANALFEALIPALFQDRSQRLEVTDAAANTLLGKALAVLQNGGGKGVKSIAVGATLERVPMVLHIVPVRGAAHDIFTQATALLVVTPVDRAAVPTAEVLQGLFDLTPAEARVARGIAQAQSVEALAVTGGVNRETVRTQLKSVLGKTGVSRQAELVALLAGKTLGKN